jgi:hypothetical protein
MTTSINNEKKNPLLLSMIVINRFEKSCGTFKRRGKKKPSVINNIGSIYIYITTMIMG